MPRIYNRKLTISPFFIVPVGLTNQEASMIIGPGFLAKEADHLLQVLYGVIENKISCPVIAQMVQYGGRTVLAVTTQTNVLDAHSKRRGLKLTYGAIADKNIFIYQSAVCNRVFSLLNKHLQAMWEQPATIAGANEIVNLFQKLEKPLDEYIGDENLDNLLNHFESEFCLTDILPLNLISRLAYRLRQRKALIYRRVKPLINLEDIEGFWRKLDKELYVGSGNCSESEAIER